MQEAFSTGASIAASVQQQQLQQLLLQQNVTDLRVNACARLPSRAPPALGACCRAKSHALIAVLHTSVKLVRVSWRELTNGSSRRWKAQTTSTASFYLLCDPQAVSSLSCLCLLCGLHNLPACMTANRTANQLTARTLLIIDTWKRNL